MSNPIGDRNLLFGIFALQRGIIGPDVFVAAMKTWMLDKRKGLAQILRDSKAINENQHAVLEEMVDGHAAKHGNDAQKSLASVSLAGPARQELEAIADADLKASLAPVPLVEKPPEPEVTEVLTPELITEIAPVKPVAAKKAKPKASAAAQRSGMPAWVLLAGGAAVAVAVLVLASAAVVFAIVQLGVLRRDENHESDPLAQVKPIEGDKPKEPDKVDPQVKDPKEDPPVKDPKEDPILVKPPIGKEVDPIPMQPTPGFTSLFNGKDLTGWKTNPKAAGNWRVVNGVLTGSTGGNGQGFLFSNRDDYRDFHLRAQVRCLGDSGSVMARTGFDFYGYNAQVNFQGFTGTLYVTSRGIHRTGGGKALPLPDGEWVDLEFIAQGNRLIVKVNGKETTDFTDTVNEFTLGHVALRHHHNSTIEVRRMEIKELKPAGPPPFVVADGFVPLFNGKDLTGWTPHKFPPGVWRVENGILIGDAAGKMHGSLYTDRPRAKDFHLRAEVKIGDQSSGYVRFRCPKQEIVGYVATINSTIPPVPMTGSLDALIPGKGLLLTRFLKPPVPAEQWFLLEILAQGERLTVKVDGRTMANVIDRNYLDDGHVGLSSANGVIAFRKVEIKELNLVAAPPVFPPAEGFVPLFNGKDLTGWKHHKTFVGDWRVENGILSGVAGPRGYGQLETDKPQPKDFHLRVEARVIGKAMGNICFRAPEGSRAGYLMSMSGFIPGDVRVGGLVVNTDRGTTMAFPPLTPPAIQRGHWFLAEVIQQGNRIILKVDGKTTFDRLDLTYSDAGHVALTQQQQEPIEFRRIEIKELIVAAPPPPPPLPEGFVPLFNGKDLTGWKMHPNQPGDWQIKDGVLIGFGPKVSSLFSERADYKDFHLRFDARINEAGLGGVMSRASFGPLTPTNNPISPTGFLASINSTSNFISKTGSMMLIGGKAMSGSQPPPPPNEWFTMEIIAKGPLVNIVMNGKSTAGIRDDVGLFPMGHIALSLRNPQGVVEFRTIGIKELNPVAAPPAPAPVEGFVPLFNGKDLTGWNAHKVFPGNWRVENGILIGSGPKTAYLYTTRGDFKDSHLRVEARFKDGQIAGTGGVLTRSPMGLKGYEAMFHFARKTGGASLNSKDGLKIIKGVPLPIEPGEWFTMEMFTEGNRVRVKVNGLPTAEFVDDANEFAVGNIALHQRANGVVEFRKIEIKELNLAAAIPPLVPAVGFVPLFNGKNLAGWQPDIKTAGNWRVENGVLIGAGEEAGVLHTPRADYRDFHLRMESRFQVPLEGASSGVIVRSSFGRSGYETLFAGGKFTGGLYLNGNDFGNPVPPNFPSNVASGEWFTLEFIAEGNRLKVKVNGKVTTDFVDAKRLFAGGHVALRQGADCKVEFRKIEIKDLVAEKIGVAPPPPKGGFHVSVPASNMAKWRVEGNELVADHLKGPMSIFFGDPKWTDYDFSVDVLRTAGENQVGFWFRRQPIEDGYFFLLGAKKGTVHLAGRMNGGNLEQRPPLLDPDVKPLENDRWYTAKIRVRGDQAQCFLDGVKLFEVKTDQLAAGSVGLRTWFTAYRFKNIKVAAPDGTVLLEGAPILDVLPPPVPPIVLPKADEFVPLFNAKDLLGWQPHAKRPGNWRVENGVLTGSAPNGGSLYSARGDYQDFHLRTEARINDKGFGRVLVRAAYDPTKIPFKVFGYEALINQRLVGDKTGTLTATSITNSILTQAKESPVQPGEWFVMEVVAKADMVTVLVNGAPVADFRDETRQFARAGHIALHQDVNAVIEFRKVEIKELAVVKPDVPPPPIVPPLPKGAKRGMQNQGAPWMRLAES